MIYFDGHITCHVHQIYCLNLLATALQLAANLFYGVYEATRAIDPPFVDSRERGTDDANAIAMLQPWPMAAQILIPNSRVSISPKWIILTPNMIKKIPFILASPFLRRQDQDTYLLSPIYRFSSLTRVFTSILRTTSLHSTSRQHCRCHNFSKATQSINHIQPT